MSIKHVLKMRNVLSILLKYMVRYVLKTVNNRFSAVLLSLEKMQPIPYAAPTDFAFRHKCVIMLDRPSFGYLVYITEEGGL